jgi:hypothetical protein
MRGGKAAGNGLFSLGFRVFWHLVMVQGRQLDSARHFPPVRECFSTHVSRFAVFGLSLLLCSATLRAQMTDVLTYHNDNARTGQTLHEEVLTPANVGDIRILWTLPTDGKVDAQPLYAAGVTIPGQGEHNVLFVATENDTVYAFDADTNNVLWKVSMLGTNEVASDDIGCTFVTPTIGITATPVIDRQLGPNGAIFVVAMSKTNTTYIQRIHALDLTTGQDLVPPTVITATYPGTGANSSGGFVVFDPEQYMDRAALLLLNGVVYTSWASHCDDGAYTGWIMGYDEHTLAQTSVLNVTPNGSDGAIWMAGGGLAADDCNNIYFLDANGTFDTNLTASGFPAYGDYGNAFVKLSTSNNVLAVADYFNMSNTVAESEGDEDLGSGGAVLLPNIVDGQGNTRQLAVGAGKDTTIYLVDRNDMGKFNPNTNANYQSVSGALTNSGFTGGIRSTPAYFNGTLYYCAVSDNLKAFPFQNAQLGTVSFQTENTFPYPGATPCVSANGTSNAIVWATQGTGAAILFAYNATNLALLADEEAPQDIPNKFITPTIASARVYVGTIRGVGVFGFPNDLPIPVYTPIQQWRNTYFHNPSNVGAGADTADPAGDGVPNLMKYALGLNPTTVVSSAQLPVPSIQADGGQNYLTLTMNRAADPTDVTYNVEVSADLQNWEFGPPFTVTLTNIPSQLNVRDNTPVTAAPVRFIRLQVTNP